VIRGAAQLFVRTFATRSCSLDRGCTRAADTARKAHALPSMTTMIIRALLLTLVPAASYVPARPAGAPPARANVPPAVSDSEASPRDRARTVRRNALDDLVATATSFLDQLAPAPAAYNASNIKPGQVVRCAAKPQNMSRAKGWTTRKPSVPGFLIGSTGCGYDYNHYRETVMRGENERAVSILTTDILGDLRAEGWPVGVGDLGENLFVDDMAYATFAIGRRFKIGATAVLEVTEPIAPCAYLCTLPYLEQKWRCADFIRTLDKRRGWYAKVVATGQVSVGDSVVAIA